MEEKDYDLKCDGCRRSYGIDRVPGGIGILPGDWVFNQYQGGEGFLGWMALQPRRHRIEFTELEPNELTALGSNIKTIEVALREYWKETFHPDEIKRLYILYFYESVYDIPLTSHFHLHLHLIPRTNFLEKFLRKYELSGTDSCDAVSTITAYNIYKISGMLGFPSQYKYSRGNPEHQHNALQLMNYLRAKM